MLSRVAAAAVLSLSFAVLAGAPRAAFADDPPKAPEPAAPAAPTAPTAPAAPKAPDAAAPAPPKPPAAAPAPPKVEEPQGAIVVAATDDAGPAARALALEVYREPLLRPRIDETTAQILAGGAPAAGAPARLTEIAEVRTSVTRAGSELVARRLLASLGSELGAALVIQVTMDGGHPGARALKPASAVFERVELGATVETAVDGARTYRWPGAASALLSLVPGGEPPPPPPPKGPVAPAPAPVPPPATLVSEQRPFWKSPWFWGPVAGVAAAGITVFILTRTTSSSGDVHLTGKVGP
jgi:hypothetical protein